MDQISATANKFWSEVRAHYKEAADQWSIDHASVDRDQFLAYLKEHAEKHGVALNNVMVNDLFVFMFKVQHQNFMAYATPFKNGGATVNFKAVNPRWT